MMSVRESEAIEGLPSLLPWFFDTDGDDPDESVRPANQRDAMKADEGCTILVVDDDLANLALAEALLQAEGFQVLVAMDAVSTFSLLKTCTPALILMDIQLPELDGWELTRRLKSDPATADIPVIAVTAYGNPGDEAKAHAAGFVDFVAKPISTRTLPDIVRRHLRRP